MYPGYARKPRAHTLALDDGRYLLLAGGEFLPESSYQEWLEQALAQSLDVRCDSIIGWRYFNDALKDDHATISAAQSRLDLHPRAVSIRWRVGNRYCTLFPASNWGDSATPDAMETHQKTLDYLAVGTYASPSSLGQATMIAKMTDETGKLKSYPVPNRACARDLRDNLVGGRIETYQAGVFDVIHEVDRNSAYVDEAGGALPCGKPGYLPRPTLEEAQEYPHYYAECVVYINSPLQVGPFPFRDDKTNLVSYPRDPGTYEKTWLWNGEIADAIAAGCTVTLKKAWAWKRSEPALRGWSRWIYAKRGPDAPSESVRGYVKRLALAAIGWHGMAPEHLRVVVAGDPDSGARPIMNANGFPTNYVAVKIVEKRPRQMTHWASYIYSQARRSLYARELAEIAAGNWIVTCDTDALKLGRPTELETSPIDLGAWKSRTLTNVRQSSGRAYYADQKMIVPGVSSQADRERWKLSLDEWLAERQERDGVEALYKLDHPIEWAIERAEKLRDWQPASGQRKTARL